MEVFKFFNSAPGDARTYQAADFAEYFGSVLSTGLLHTNEVPGMSVTVEAGTLNTVVNAGKAIMKGHLYENTAPLTLSHSIPEATLDRIDRIVLRLDLRNAERNIKLHVKQGVSSATPVAPALQRDNFIYELSLAQVRVRANTSSLRVSDLLDERLDENLCGIVYSLISIPTDQFQLYITARTAELGVEAEQFEQQLIQNLADYEREYQEWFADLKASGFASASEFAAHKADLASQEVGKGADAIGLPDPNSLFTATSVGGAMRELFTNVSNGKSTSGSLATAISDKGGTLVDSDSDGIYTFSELAEGVVSISQGGMEIPGETSFTNRNISAVDDDGNLYITESNGTRLVGRKYSPNMTLIAEVAHPTLNVRSFSPEGYGVEGVNYGILHVYNNTGTLLATIEVPRVGQEASALREGQIIFRAPFENWIKIINFAGTELFVLGSVPLNVPMFRNKKGNFVFVSPSSNMPNRVLRMDKKMVLTRINNTQSIYACFDFQNW